MHKKGKSNKKLKVKKVMPRKKKKEEEVVEFVPSKYQLAIFDFIDKGNGNLVIEAEAGSGKSTVILKCIERLPKDSKILLTAFNTSIVDDLKKKLKASGLQDVVECKTMHSLGYGILMSNFGSVIDKKPNDFKYNGYVYNNIDALSDVPLSKKERSKFAENVIDLVNYGRFYMCTSVKDMTEIELHYSINCIANEKEAALKVMQWGKEHIETIDFTDMVWLPNVLNCKPYGRIYDWIFCDEAQDTTKGERELLLRCTKLSTRMVFAGQEIQAIYSFQGADYKAFREIRNLPNMTSLPLSISYRCPKNVVSFVNKFSPTMEAKDDAIDGEVVGNCDIHSIADGDMVLCRLNAPLLKTYSDLISIGKTACILGKEIGKGMVSMIKKTKEPFLNKDLSCKGVFSVLYNSLFDDIDSVMKKNSIPFEMAILDFEVSRKYDLIKSLESICDGINETSELIDKVESLFVDKKKKGILLSTIHKAKGLEADNVYICCNSIMPLSNARDEWEFQQEKNLEYVAYTRAKKRLGFLREDGYEDYIGGNEKSSDLSEKKLKVFMIHGGNERCGVVKPSVEASKYIISNSTDLSSVKKGKEITIGSSSGYSYSNDLSSLTAHKRKKLRRK